MVWGGALIGVALIGWFWPKNDSGRPGMKTRVVTDVSSLPTYGFGTSASTWWGTLGFCAIEGTGFALAIGMYLFLAFSNPHRPLGFSRPVHWPGTALTLLLLLSIIPNVIVERAAHEEDLPRVRWLLVLMTAIGFVAIAIRFVEFYMLIPRWDLNAYGSIVWLLLGLHATHLITDVGDLPCYGADVYEARPRQAFG